jgi:hypothetical protein
MIDADDDAAWGPTPTDAPLEPAAEPQAEEAAPEPEPAPVEPEPAPEPVAEAAPDIFAAPGTSEPPVDPAVFTPSQAVNEGERSQAQIDEEAANAPPPPEPDLHPVGDPHAETVAEAAAEATDLIGGDTLIAMYHPDGGTADAFESDARGNVLVPAAEVPVLVSHGFLIAEEQG